MHFYWICSIFNSQAEHRQFYSFSKCKKQVVHTKRVDFKQEEQKIYKYKRNTNVLSLSTAHLQNCRFLPVALAFACVQLLRWFSNLQGKDTLHYNTITQDSLRNIKQLLHVVCVFWKRWYQLFTCFNHICSFSLFPPFNCSSKPWTYLFLKGEVKLARLPSSTSMLWRLCLIILMGLNF